MVDGTRYAQLSEAVAANRQETAANRQETAANRQETAANSKLLKVLMEQVSKLTDSVAALNPNPNRNGGGQGSSSGENVGGRNERSAEGRDNSSENHTGRGGGVFTRNLKLDFPRFDGNEPINWILKAQQFYDYNQTPDQQKVFLAAFHMEGGALIWYNWLMDSEYAGGWEDFVSALKTHFAPSTFDDLVGAFTKLKQTSTVEDYQTQFEILSNKIQGLSEEFKVSTFLSDLREEVRITVTMLKPKDLTTAFGFARLQEEEVKLRGEKSEVYPLGVRLPKLFQTTFHFHTT